MDIVATADRQAARAIANSEPFERGGWRTHRVCAWMLNEGAAVALGRHPVDARMAARQ
jgi:hypothetical protein